MRKPTKKQVLELKRIAALADDQMDTSDIPEIDENGGIRGRFQTQETQAISIRLSQIDLSHARVIAEKKGLSWQAYINAILHEAIENELRADRNAS